FAPPAAKPAAPELELTEDYGAVIRKAREARNLSWEQLGQQLGIRAQEIQHMEEGKLHPPEKDCRKLENFLKIKLLAAPPAPEQSPEELAKKLVEMRGKGRGVTLADMVEIKVKKS
ncbi:MAG: helix-turn-helix domain-containing protein, partial [Candidatus Micrarchaeota archaeon]